MSGIKRERVVHIAENLKDEAIDRIANSADKVKKETAELTDTVARGATELADTVSSRLKAAGVDADVMLEAAKGQASELQRVLADEVRTRPLRALGVAAAVGVLFGLLSSR